MTLNDYIKNVMRQIDQMVPYVTFKVGLSADGRYVVSDSTNTVEFTITSRQKPDVKAMIDKELSRGL